ncbi:MAG: hypothetical protein PWP38_1765 [Clostridiales bacterium]|jgi:hypothetical protein|nr:hypothetical protein [Clostridiales bacterium]
MAYDFKKAYKMLYLPPKTPTIVTVPKMQFIAVRGKGNPNDEQGEYQNAIAMLYPVAYTLRMSHKGAHKIDDFFEYVVPPLEGFWWQEGIEGVDYTQKDAFHWISIIRLPDFISEVDVNWAIEKASAKKKQDFSKVIYYTYDEGICVQCMHIGPFEHEPVTTAKMAAYAEAQGYQIDIGPERFHHEIYLSDFRKTAPEKLKTVVRHPIKLRE